LNRLSRHGRLNSGKVRLALLTEQRPVFVVVVAKRALHHSFCTSLAVISGSLSFRELASRRACPGGLNPPARSTHPRLFDLPRPVVHRQLRLLGHTTAGIDLLKHLTGEHRLLGSASPH